jgi:hypothetical protein
VQHSEAFKGFVYSAARQGTCRLSILYHVEWYFVSLFMPCRCECAHKCEYLLQVRICGGYVRKYDDRGRKVGEGAER